MSQQLPLDALLYNPILVNQDFGNLNPQTLRYFQQATRAINNYLGSTTAQTIVATSGQAIIINPTAATLYLKPAGTLATLLVTLPTSPQDGLDVTIKTTQTITALTLTAVTPNTILDPVTTLGVNSWVVYRYILDQNQWIRVG